MVKTYFIFLPITLAAGFFFVQAFWSMAPIPSGFYPATIINWPVSAYGYLIWVTRPAGFFKLDWMLASFLITAVLDIGFKFTRLPISMIGVAAGAATVPPYALNYFLGSLLGRYLFQRRFGKEEWGRLKGLVVTGLLIGIGISVTLGSMTSLVLRSTWPLPY